MPEHEHYEDEDTRIRCILCGGLLYPGGKCSRHQCFYEEKR